MSSLVMVPQSEGVMVVSVPTTPGSGSRLPPSTSFHGLICVPVMHSRNVCGTLAFAGLQHRTFSDDLRTFVNLAASELGQHIETLYLRHRLLALLPKAQVVFDAAPHDPDTAPTPHEENA